MLNFKIGDRVKVNDKLNVNFDDSEGEIKLIGQSGIVIEAMVDGAFPYQIRFDNKETQELNMIMGSRLFDEYELDASL